MPETHLEDVFDPEVASATATAEFPNALALNFPGAPFVAPFPPETQMEEGSRVRFPRWKPIGSFSDFGQGDTLSTEKMKTEQDMATVIGGGKAVEIDDWADLSSRGDPSEEAGRQYARRAAEYVDDKLIAEAETTPLSSDYDQELTWDVWVDAIINHWGDESFENIGAVIVHSSQMGTLMKLDQFTKANELGEDGGTSVLNGFIGRLGRYPVFVSDRLTVDTSGSVNKYSALVLKTGALGLRFQRTLLVERDRDVLNKSWVLAADVHFAPHLMFADPRPVFELKTQ